MNYNQLTDVKIMEKAKPVSGGWFRFVESTETAKGTNEAEQWAAIYHMENDKYIVTNDFFNVGLNDHAGKVNIVGYGDSLDSIMFVIWEHQTEQGKDYTILDQIREIKNEEIEKASQKMWNWEEKAADTTYFKHEMFNPWEESY
ncbi:hypothetical protein [Paenibacillus bovis]|uniref:Uncharacterized protein n=1 Tax=Paenibacillus bovis TaxID=1616788 RepID=A0A172ZKE6_9BACL|nr:hypothetical protein [Paenibacillus bovis]ANF98104.1 hypothetical protein AR543_20220 [Paenibacillus bovis]